MSFSMSVVVILLAVSPIKPAEMSPNPLDKRTKIIEQATEILVQGQNKEKRMSIKMAGAIEVLGEYRSSDSVAHLVRVIDYRMDFPSSRYFENHGFRMEQVPGYSSRQASVDNGYRLSNYPAAMALISIGLPSVEALVWKINASDGKFHYVKVTLYAKIFKTILKRLAKPYLLDEKKRAPEKVRPLYDQIIQKL